jgi:hypothetical protein
MQNLPEWFLFRITRTPTIIDGAIVILAKKSKTLRRNPLIATAPIPLYLDKTKRLIQERIVDLQDQILIFKENEVVRFGILDYQQVFQELVQK